MQSKKKEVPKRIRDGTLTSLFFHVSRKMHSYGGPDFSQQKVLRILYRDGDLSQKELQEKMQIQSGSLSELAGKLEDKGYIEKKRFEGDRRKMVISLTDEGREAIRHYNEWKDEVLFTRLSEDEREQFRYLLEKLDEEDV